MAFATMKPALVRTDLMEPNPRDTSPGRRVLRACRKVWHRVLPRKMTRSFARAGIRYRIDASWDVQYRLMQDGRFEHRQIMYFFNGARRRGADVFLDVGANFGYYSLLAAKTGDFGEIHAFEPHPEMYEILLRHISLNGRQNVITPHNIAASAKESEMFIDDFAHGSARISATERKNATIAVRAVLLDSVLDFSGRNIAVKLDVEGHTSPALDGMRNLLSQNRVFLQAEILPEDTEVIYRLMSDGFRLIYHEGGDFYFVNDDNSSWR